jgi:hypothetical protein
MERTSRNPDRNIGRTGEIQRTAGGSVLENCNHSAPNQIGPNLLVVSTVQFPIPHLTVESIVIKRHNFMKKLF